MEYIILMDVSGDIDKAAAEAAGVRFIPMEYSIGGEMRTCSGPEDETVLKAFYDGQRGGDFTKTSQISPYMYEEYLKPIFAEGKSVLYLCLSGGLSSTFQSACMAKKNLEEEFPNCRFMPVDTLAATGGMGVLAERAVRNRAQGMSLEENHADLNAAAKKIRHWFVVEDLMYLKRGGRVSAATAVLGTALNVKPILIINPQGKLDTVAKKRGTKAALKHLIQQFGEEYDPASGDVIYIIHGDDAEKAQKLMEEVQGMYPEAVIRVSMLSPIIGAHTGPGMAAVCFMGK